MSDFNRRLDRRMWTLFAVTVIAVCFILMSLSRPSYPTDTEPRPGCVFEGAREIECGASACLVCFGDENSQSCYRFNYYSCKDIEER